MLRLMLRMTKGYRLRPWRSPYLRWRLETYAGIPAEQIDFAEFCRQLWRNRAQFLRYLRWAERMAQP